MKTIFVVVMILLGPSALAYDWGRSSDVTLAVSVAQLFPEEK